MKAPINGTQRNMRIEIFRILESGVTATASDSQNITVMPEGFTRGSVTEAANNVYTLTFTEPFGRAPNFHVSALDSGTGVSYICNNVSTSATAISWRCENDASTAGAATGFHVTVIGSDSNDGQI
jgi:hypothetical protein